VRQSRAEFSSSFQSTIAAACRFAFQVKTSRQAQRRTSPGRRFDVRSIAVCPPSSEDVSSTAVKQTDGLRGSVEESRMQVMSGPHQISVGYTGPTCECPFLFCYSSPSLYISSPWGLLLRISQEQPVGRKSGGHDVVVLLDAHAHVDKDNNGRRQ